MSCVNADDCEELNGVDNTFNCMVAIMGGINGAVSTGLCLNDTNCGQADQAIDDSAFLLGMHCNANTDADLMSLDINDAFYWDYWMQGGSTDTKSVTRAACTTNADCTVSGDTCASITLSYVTGTYCAPMNGWCSTADMDTAEPPVATGTYTDGG